MSVKQLVPIFKDIIRTLNINRIQEEVKIKLLSPLVSCCKFKFAERWTNMAKQNLEGFSKLSFSVHFSCRNRILLFVKQVFFHSKTQDDSIIDAICAQ